MGNTAVNPFTGKKQLEINPNSKLIEKLKSKFEGNPEEDISKTIGLLYETALLSSGYNINDPNKLAEKIQQSLLLNL